MKDSKQEVIERIYGALDIVWALGWEDCKKAPRHPIRNNLLLASELYDRIAPLMAVEYPDEALKDLLGLIPDKEELYWKIKCLVEGQPDHIAGLRKKGTGECQHKDIKVYGGCRDSHDYINERRDGKDQRGLILCIRRRGLRPGRRVYDGLRSKGGRRDGLVVPITVSMGYSRRRGIADRRDGKDRRAPQS